MAQVGEKFNTTDKAMGKIIYEGFEQEQTTMKKDAEINEEDDPNMGFGLFD